MSISTSSIKREHPYLIGIAGGSGSGKTSVAHIIFKYVGINNCLLFSMDTYYKNLSQEELNNVHEYNFDSPEALDLDLLSFHLSELMNWRSIDMPTYNFSENKRGVDTIKVIPNKFIIFEGILAFHDPRILNWMDLKIFVDWDGDIRLARRIYRDIIERGRDMLSVIERYHKFVKPAFDTYIKPTRKCADAIIPRGAENTQAIDLISQHWKNELSYWFPPNTISQIKNSNNNKNGWSVDDAFSLEEKFKTCVCLVSGEDNRETLWEIFNNFINGVKMTYYEWYMSVLIENLCTLWPPYYKDKESTLIITLSKVYLDFIIDDLSKKQFKFKNVVLFYPILWNVNQHWWRLVNVIEEKEEIASWTIASIYLCEEPVRVIKASKVKYVSWYYGERWKEFQSYIEKGGYVGEDCEGEYSKNIAIFTKKSFEKVFIDSISML